VLLNILEFRENWRRDCRTFLWVVNEIIRMYFCTVKPCGIFKVQNSSFKVYVLTASPSSFVVKSYKLFKDFVSPEVLGQ
jgi:hypothetical protein